MEKKWKLLKEAYDKYPKDTKCQWGEFGGIIVCTGEYHFADGYDLPRIHDTNDYAIFDGEEWADIIMEKPERKFIMKSEDGVDLYSNDPLFTVRYNRGGECKWNDPLQKVMSSEVSNILLHDTEDVKGFYSKQAAQSWVDQKNKPHFITVAKDSQYPVEVYNDRIRIKCNGSENHSDNIIIRESELKEIYEAYYSLRD